MTHVERVPQRRSGDVSWNHSIKRDVFRSQPDFPIVSGAALPQEASTRIRVMRVVLSIQRSIFS
jgi:hypothetical protein